MHEHKICPYGADIISLYTITNWCVLMCHTVGGRGDAGFSSSEQVSASNDTSSAWETVRFVVSISYVSLPLVLI